MIVARRSTPNAMKLDRFLNASASRELSNAATVHGLPWRRAAWDSRDTLQPAVLNL